MRHVEFVLALVGYCAAVYFVFAAVASVVTYP